MLGFRASWMVRLVAFGIGILVAAAVFGSAFGLSEDLCLLYVSGAWLLAVARIFTARTSGERLDRSCSACFSLDTLVRFLRSATNTFSLANHSVVGGDRHVAAVW